MQNIRKGRLAAMSSIQGKTHDLNVGTLVPISSKKKNFSPAYSCEAPKSSALLQTAHIGFATVAMEMESKVRPSGRELLRAG